MKRTFGNALTRLFWGGTTLTSVEWQLLTALTASLPPGLRTVVEAQFEAYNLVQRECDGRALNFYRRTFSGVTTRGLSLLKMTSDEAPLSRLTATIDDSRELVHATLTAVRGRAFCIALNRALPPTGQVSVVEVKQAWRSNFEVVSTK